MLKSVLYKYITTYQDFPKAIWINIIALFLVTSGFMMSSFFTLFLNEKHIPISIIAIVLAGGGLGAMLGSYISGILITRHPLYTTRIIQISLIGFALMVGSFPLIDHISLFFAIAFCSNFCYGVFSTASQYVAFNHSKTSDHPRVMALYRVANNLGLAFATSIGGFLASIDFMWFFIFSASMSLIGAAMFFRFRVILEPILHRGTTNAWDKQDINMNKIIQRFSNKPFIYLCTLFLLYNVLFFQTNSTYGLYLRDMYHIDLKHFGLLFMLNFLLIIFIEVPLMAFFKNSSQILLTLYGTIAVGAGLFILPFSTSYAMAWLSVFLWSIGEILATSPFSVLAVRFANPRREAFYLGIFQAILSMGLIIAPLIGSLLYPVQQSKFLWMSCGIISILMIFGYLYLKRYESEHALC